jgi:geranylgeranyl pyrophosphate synthase
MLAWVQEDLKRVEQKMREGVAARHEQLGVVLDYLLSGGGKRLRPALVLMVTRFGSPDYEKSIALAAAVEMLHTATLVHDDVVDNSLVRRGNPTLNATWSQGATVLMGDYLFARAANLAAESENVRIISIFSDTLTVICSGELEQVFGRVGRAPTLDEYQRRIYAKTASLFAAGAETGAILGGLPESQVQALRDYGRYLGMAFQIIDDVLDFTGDQASLGKPVANDLRHGIITLPVILFLENRPDHPTIGRILAYDTLEDSEIVAVVDEIRASGAVDAAVDEARQFTAAARAALSPLPDSQSRQTLLDLAQFVVERSV